LRRSGDWEKTEKEKNKEKYEKIEKRRGTEKQQIRGRKGRRSIKKRRPESGETTEADLGVIRLVVHQNQLGGQNVKEEEGEKNSVRRFHVDSQKERRSKMAEHWGGRGEKNKRTFPSRGLLSRKRGRAWFREREKKGTRVTIQKGGTKFNSTDGRGDSPQQMCTMFKVQYLGPKRERRQKSEGGERGERGDNPKKKKSGVRGNNGQNFSGLVWI